MRDDEIYVRVFGRKHVDDLGPAGHVDQHRKVKRPRRLADFASRHGLKAVHFDATKTPTSRSVLDHPKNSAGIAASVDKCESDELLGVLGNKLGHLGIRL